MFRDIYVRLRNMVMRPIWDRDRRKALNERIHDSIKEYTQHYTIQCNKKELFDLTVIKTSKVAGRYMGISAWNTQGSTQVRYTVVYMKRNFILDYAVTFYTRPTFLSEFGIPEYCLVLMALIWSIMSSFNIVPSSAWVATGIFSMVVSVVVMQIYAIMGFSLISRSSLEGLVAIVKQIANQSRYFDGFVYAFSVATAVMGISIARLPTSDPFHHCKWLIVAAALGWLIKRPYMLLSIFDARRYDLSWD